jgi:hypothetical protein
MKITIQLSLIYFLLSSVACSPKFPLRSSTGDLTYLKLKNGRVISTMILDGDQQQLRLSHKGILYQIAIDSIEYVKVKGYNELERGFYFGFGVLAIIVGATSLSEISASTLAILVLGALSLAAGKAASRKFRFNPAQAEDLGKLRLHFQYPQGLTPDQRTQILKKHQQPDFLSLEDLGL